MIHLLKAVDGSTTTDLVHTTDVKIFVLVSNDYYIIYTIQKSSYTLLTTLYAYVFSLIDILFIYHVIYKEYKKCTMSSCEHALKKYGKWEKVATDVYIRLHVEHKCYA